MPRCSQRTVGRDAFRQDRRRAFRTGSGMTGWSWWRGADRRTLFRLAWKGYAPGRGSSFVSSSSGSTPPSRCCSCPRRISCIKAASRASSSAPGSCPGFSPELPGGCSGSPMARFSSNPGSLAQYPARSVVLRDRPRLSCPATSPPTGSSDTIRGSSGRSSEGRPDLAQLVRTRVLPPDAGRRQPASTQPDRRIHALASPRVDDFGCRKPKIQRCATAFTAPPRRVVR